MPPSLSEKLYNHANMRTNFRTVDPALSEAAAGHRHSSLTASAALSELGHRLVLEDLLHNEGAVSVLLAGERFARTSDHEVVRALATSNHPHDLACRFRRVERLFHLGHRTDHELSDGSLQVRHVANEGADPTVAESLFVFGSFIGMCRRIRVRSLIADVGDARSNTTAAAWPLTKSTTFDFLVAPLVLHLRWTENPSLNTASGSPSLNDRLRIAVAQQPGRHWNLSAAAAVMDTSSRSLQRAHLAASTTVSGEIIAGRVDAATALLERTDLSVALIAALCGFADAAHFNRCFRRLNSNTPGRHRALRRSADK